MTAGKESKGLITLVRHAQKRRKERLVARFFPCGSNASLPIALSLPLSLKGDSVLSTYRDLASVAA